MKPEIKVFTKDNPCTKLHLWNCFRGARGFKRVPVVEAKAQIGANAPRGMLRKGRIRQLEVKGVEYYQLTDAGTDWLKSGIQSYVKRHPEDRELATNLPKSY